MTGRTPMTPWILWLIPLARAQVGQVCSACACPNPGWLGSQSLQSCADSCALKSSHFQHASGTRFDNDPGDNNCACCTALSTKSGDSGMGINVYESQSSPPYSPVCELCWCNLTWLGPRSISECAATCSGQGFSHFQHANGLKPDGTTGDYNCGCCSSSVTTSDPTWGVNVYSLEPQSSPPCSPVCELCWCNLTWLGPRSISACATTCFGQGFSHFQHGNGLKPDGTTGDYNCGCCSSSVTVSDPTWGVNVYSLELPIAAASDLQASTMDTVDLEQLVQKPQISSTLTPSVEDGTTEEDFSTGLPAAGDIPTGLLAIVGVLALLTCLLASLGVFCCYRIRKLQGAARAELPTCHISNPTALPSLTPSMALKPLLFSWSSRMTAEWPRGKVQRFVVSEAGFEACGRHYEFCKLENGWHFVWEDGTVQKVESIRRNVLQWRTQHPHPAWQDFRWICTPQCFQSGSHHDMELSDIGPYRCGLCARSCTAEKHWNCQQHQVHLCPVCAELPPEMPTLGVAAAYVVNVFPPLARRATTDESPNFYAICPFLAHGENGMGYDKTCPRDGRLRCSIVDALEDAHSGKVTHFVSWCWAYSLNDVVSSIERWLQKSGEDPLSVFLWMCFFCNNQYRIKEEAIQTPSEDLGGIFESHLIEAGQMLVLLDTVLEPTYVTRAWCIFESYVSIARDIPMEIILPRTAENFFQETMRCGRIDLLMRGVQELDVRRAKAGSLADEDSIKRIILNTTGFDVVNHAVRSRLVDQLTVLFRELLMPRPP